MRSDDDGFDVFTEPMACEPVPERPEGPAPFSVRLAVARRALQSADDQFRVRLGEERLPLGALTEDQQRGALAAAQALGGTVTRLPDGTCVVYRPGGLERVARAYRQREAARGVVAELAAHRSEDDDAPAATDAHNNAVTLGAA
jgi:hypothetical protein